MRFSIVIVTCNGLHDLKPCLESLASQLSSGWEVVVVDNASTDGTRAFIESQATPMLRPLFLQTNTGFAMGNNRGAEVARGEWLFLLNNDTTCAAGTLRVLEECANRFAQFRIFSSRVVRASDGRIDSLGIRYSRLLRGIQIGSGTADRWAEPREVFGASGAAMMVHRSVIEDIGLFDTALFAYQEDVDFAVRARLAGYRCLHLPGAVVHHKGGGTSSSNPSRFRYYNQRNMELVFRNLPRRVLWKYGLGHFAYSAYQIIKWAWKGDGRTVLRAKIDALAHPARTLEDRCPQRVNPKEFEEFLEQKFPASLHLC